MDQSRNILALLPAMNYNMAAPTRRLGLTKRNKYASLHENAHDSHATPHKSQPTLNLPPDDDSLLKPPQESNQESDISDSGASTPENQGSRSPETTPGWLENQSNKCFIQKSKPRRVTYGKKMANSSAVQKARPPRNRNIVSPKFIAPVVTNISEETVRKFENEGEFDRSRIPNKRTSKKAHDVEFEHVKRSKLGGKLEEDRFVPVPGTSTAPRLGISTPRQPTVSTQISDINEDIDDLMKRRPSKELSQDNHGDKESKRKESPEPEFMAPPKASSSGIVEHNLPQSPSPLKDIQPSNNFLSGSQPIKCPVCSTTMSQTTMDDFKTRNHLSTNTRLTARQQDLLHKFHSKADTRNLWQERRYPEIDWKKLPKRLGPYKQYISSVIDRTKPSHYVSQLHQEVLHRGRKTVILADERRAGETVSRHLGYYGTRGQRVIGDWLLAEFSAHLRQKSKDHEDIKLAGSVGGYIQKMLIPEMIQQLIIEDLQCDYELEKGAQSRADEAITRNKKSAHGSGELSTLIGSLTQDEDEVDDQAAPSPEDSDMLEPRQNPKKPWLARFVAWESAHCGLLLSEETEDIVIFDKQ